MNADLLKRVDPKRYFDQFLSAKIYPDGRATDEHRPFRLDVGVEKEKAHGSALVQQSGACVTCSVGLSVAPVSDEPAILFDLGAVEDVPKAAVEEAEIVLERVLKSGYLMDVQQFLVGPTANGEPMAFELRWTLHLRVVVVCSDGPVIDAVLSAVQAAILDTRLPAVEYTGEATLEDYYKDIPLPFEVDKVKLWGVGGGEDISEIPTTASTPRRLELKDLLQAMTFLLHDDEVAGGDECSTIFADPTSDLLSLFPSRCEVVIGEGGTLYGLSINSSSDRGIDNRLVQRMVEMAERRRSRIADAVRECLAKGNAG